MTTQKINMKNLITFICIAFVALACTDNQRARKFGGNQTIKLEAGKRLVTATWKRDDLWFLVEPMDSAYIPQTKTFYENSSYGVWEGSVTFVESK